MSEKKLADYTNKDSLLQSDVFLFSVAAGIVVFIEIPVLYIMWRVKRKREPGESVWNHAGFVLAFAVGLALVFFDFATDVVQLARILLLSSEQFCDAADAVDSAGSTGEFAAGVVRRKSARAFVFASVALVLFMAAVCFSFFCGARIWADAQGCRAATARWSLLASYLCILVVAVLAVFHALRLTTWDVLCTESGGRDLQFYGIFACVCCVLVASVLLTIRSLFCDTQNSSYAEAVAEELYEWAKAPVRYWNGHADRRENERSVCRFLLCVLLAFVTLPLGFLWILLNALVMMLGAAGLALCLSDGEATMDVLASLEIVDQEQSYSWSFPKMLLLKSHILNDRSEDGFGHAHRRFVALHAFEFVVMTALQVYFLVDQVGSSSLFDWVSLGLSIYMVTLPCVAAIQFGRSFNSVCLGFLARLFTDPV